jgi:iron(III) transport system ATP-binding protein
MSTRITLEAVSKHYPAIGGGGITKAVDRISLEIQPGHLFFLLGPSGCGKTTLLRMIAGFIEPTSGRIEFNGRDVTRLPPNKRNTGMVFQSYALWPHMSVAQNVGFGLTVRKVGKAEREERVAEALRAVRMIDYAKRKPNQLSGGQQQRVALARALVVRPEVLLLDEPLSNLDAKLRLEMRSEIRRICTETGITTIYVTHDQKEALSMADDVAVLDMGVVAQVGAPRAIYNRPASRFVADFLGETNFIDAEVTGQNGEGLSLHCPAGDIHSTAFDHANPPIKGNVTCSVRPEALRLSEPNSHNTLSGKVLDSIYLGEMAQHIIELRGEMRVKVFELHPAHRDWSSAPEVGVSVAPEDVVVLAD